MANLHVSVCNHSGMATFLIADNESKVKVDLMPDELTEAKAIAQKNPDQLKIFFSGIDSAFAERLGAFPVAEIQKNILTPRCNL